MTHAEKVTWSTPWLSEMRPRNRRRSVVILRSPPGIIDRKSLSGNRRTSDSGKLHGGTSNSM